MVRNLGRVEFMTVVVMCGLLMGLALFSQGYSKQNAKEMVCLLNLRRQGLALSLYTSDHNDRLPQEDWLAAAKPYLDETFKSEQNYSFGLRCPSVKQGHGYVLNSNLQGKPLLLGSETVAMIFESDDLRRSVTAHVIQPLDSSRHRNRQGVVFADGHARMVPSDRVANVPVIPPKSRK